MDNEQVIANGGGNYSRTVLEDAEDRLMKRVNREVEEGQCKYCLTVTGWDEDSCQECRNAVAEMREER